MATVIKIKKSTGSTAPTALGNGELGYTHYENMINLHKLIGKGRFRFIALPLKIKGGSKTHQEILYTGFKK